MIMGPFPMAYAKKITHHATTICQIRILKIKKPWGFPLKLGRTHV